MRALVKKFPRKGLWLDEVSVPTIKGNEVLIKVERAAICGSDVHIYDWNDWAQRSIPVPLVIGHEFVGQISEKGELVTRYTVGDRVSAEGHVTCGVCRRCRGGLRHLCTQTQGIGVQLPGCFAEYVVVPAENLWPVPDGISDDYAAVFDPLGNAVHTALSFDLIGEDVLITGAGPIGAMAVGICKMVGARYVVITDVNDYRLDIARKMGATRAVNVDKTRIQTVMSDLGMIGFDVGLEMSGNPNALGEMIENMINGGKIALLGIMDELFSFDLNQVVFKGLTIKGIFGREMFETWYKMTILVRQGLNIDPVITHSFAMEDFEKAFEVIQGGRSGKVILSIS
ncbi:MAG: L-threonine 3-dehydrogenase [Proteobacteria bacterium]|nr:L-threonine 3-dehydrogenase [Pseudomonadota bacterium]